MSNAISDWMPTGAITASGLRKAWGPVLDAWKDHWFLSGDTAITLCADEVHLPPVVDSAILSIAPAVDLHIHRAAHRLLLQRLLGDQPSGGELTHADRTVIDGLVRAVARDLGDRLARTFGAYNSDNTVRTQYEVHIDGGHAFTLACPPAALVAPARKTIARSPNRQAPVAAMSAVAGCEIELRADLGTCEIGIAELRALNPGDILILDEKIGTPAILRSQNGTRIAQGTLVEVAGRNGLKIQ